MIRRQQMVAGARRAGGALALLLAVTFASLPALPSALAASGHQGSATVSKIMLHAEPIGGKFAVTNASLSHIHVGQRIRIVLYAYVVGVTHPATAHVELAISHGGNQLFLSRSNFTVSKASLGGSTAGWRWFWNDVRYCRAGSKADGRPGCLPRTGGRYTVTGSIEMNGRQMGAGFYLSEG
jgi:hypothetical protein